MKCNREFVKSLRDLPTFLLSFLYGDTFFASGVLFFANEDTPFVCLLTKFVHGETVFAIYVRDLAKIVREIAHADTKFAKMLQEFWHIVSPDKSLNNIV